MSVPRTNAVVHHLRRAAILRDGGGQTDGELLTAFLARRDQAAFEALVRRHGPMVHGVCSRLLRDHQDAEDAFQVTFLVLVRKATSVVPREQVGNWLYGVAYRTALEARRAKARRRVKEQHVKPQPYAPGAPDASWQELHDALDHALSCLPDKYRLPIVLCDLEGRTRKEVARQLQLPEGTLSNRLAGGRKLLAKRLSAKGLALSAGSLAWLMGEQAASGSVPATLIATTVNTAYALAAGSAATGAVSAKVSLLMQKVMKTMLLTKIKVIGILTLSLTALTSVTSAVSYRALAAGEPQSRAVVLHVARADEPNRVPHDGQRAQKVESPKPLSAEQVLDDLYRGYVKENGQYLTYLKRLRGLEPRYRDSNEWKKWYFGALGQVSSLVGRQREALTCFDQAARDPWKGADPDAWAGYEAPDALETILQMAEGRQVIMINKDQGAPRHRGFILMMLNGLYRRGFRYFAVETLSTDDTQLQQRGYPTLDTGMVDPMDADLVRTALRLGYRVVPYEFEKSRSPMTSNDPARAQNERESEQAKNLKERILAKDPKAKILVSAGFSQIWKKPTAWDLGRTNPVDKTRAGKWVEYRPMAVNFKAITGIDPLCVGQDEMTERGSPTAENPDYRLAIERGLLKDKAIVLRDRKTKAYYGPAESEGKYDLVVFHPRSTYENGRPTWLRLGGMRQPLSLPEQHKPPKGSSYLAQAFYAAEDSSKAAPVDQIEYRAGEPVPCLWLPAGEFHVRILDEAGKTVHEFTVKK